MLRITRQVASNIARACREVLGRRHFEIGERSWDGKPEQQDGFNLLLCGDSYDQRDMYELHKDFVGKEVADYHGYVALDVYAFSLPVFGQEPEDHLDTNLYILLNRDGKVLYCSTDDLGHSRHMADLLAKFGVPVPAALTQE